MFTNMTTGEKYKAFGLFLASIFIAFIVMAGLEMIFNKRVEAQSPQRFQLQSLERHSLNGYGIVLWVACDPSTGTLLYGNSWESGGGILPNGCAKTSR